MSVATLHVGISEICGNLACTMQVQYVVILHVQHRYMVTLACKMQMCSNLAYTVQEYGNLASTVQVCNNLVQNGKKVVILVPYAPWSLKDAFVAINDLYKIKTQNL